MAQVTYEDLDTRPGLSLEEPAGWVLLYVVAALLVLFIFHVGFRGAVAS
jgi:hypothetical protein